MPGAAPMHERARGATRSSTASAATVTCSGACSRCPRGRTLDPDAGRVHRCPHPVRQGGTMRRLSALLLVLLAASACEKHGAQPRPAAVSNPAPADVPPDAGPHQTIRLGQNAIVPDAPTIAPSTTIDFQNMTWE